MIYVALAEAVLIAALVAVVYGLEKANSRERADRAAAYEQTLQTMANRIQRPELIPVANGREPFEFPDQKPDEWARAGQIDIDDKYGLDDDG